MKGKIYMSPAKSGGAWLAAQLALAACVFTACSSHSDKATQPATPNVATSAQSVVYQPPAGVTQFLASGKIDLPSDTVTLPLHQGALQDGRRVWYVLTDVSDAATAKAQGLVYAPAIINAIKAKSTRSATVNANGTFTFNKGSIDFAPKRSVTPGTAPNYFPPTAANPGSVADADYSPFVEVNGIVYNAPILAFNVSADQINFCDGQPDLSLVHDKVVKICPKDSTVSLALTHGYSSGKEVIYLSFDANLGLPATLEAATLSSSEDDLKDVGVSLPLYAVVNGATGLTNPQRQGFDSALAGDGSPLNILGGLPSVDTGYSPLWDVRMAVWSDAAVTGARRHRLTSKSDLETAVKALDLTGPGGTAIGASGILVNCPVVGIFEAAGEGS